VVAKLVHSPTTAGETMPFCYFQGVSTIRDTVLPQ